MKQWKRQTELSVDKINGTITSVINEQSEQGTKITQIEQDINGIEQSVKDVVDYKREVSGVTEIHLEDAGEADVLELEIQGNKTYESNLFPGENLFPSENLQPNMEVM